MRKQFGDRLKELRLEKNMTQEELAKIFNTGKASISHYESNRRVPDASVIEKFAAFFKVTTDYILGISNHKDGALIDTEEKADEVTKEILQILVDTGQLTKEEADGTVEIDPDKKNRLMNKIKKIIKLSQEIEEL